MMSLMSQLSNALLSAVYSLACLSPLLTSGRVIRHRRFALHASTLLYPLAGAQLGTDQD